MEKKIVGEGAGKIVILSSHRRHTDLEIPQGNKRCAETYSRQRDSLL